MAMNRGFSKTIGFILAIILIFSSTGAVFADVLNVAAFSAAQNKGYQNARVTAVQKPDVIVKYNAEILSFKDVNGETVYPVIYNGATYLPVRAIADIMGEEIEWRETLKTVFIGKTLSRPVKLHRREDAEPKYAVSVSSEEISEAKSTQITLVERRDFKIMYDFEQQNFKNSKGEQIYPLIYNGTAYLPIKAVSELVGEPVEWDAGMKTVYIGSHTPLEEEPETARRASRATLALQDIYYEEAELYNEAIASISRVSEAVSYDELYILSVKISAEYQQAVENTEKVREILNTSRMTGEELAACEALLEFAEIAEYYILVMESISYMALEGEDYSIMQDTFAQYAYDAANAQEAARLAVEVL